MHEIIIFTQTQTTFHPILGGVPVGPDRPCQPQQLFGREIIFEVFQPMWSRYVNVTDRRTDDMQSHNRAMRIVSHGN